MQDVLPEDWRYWEMVMATANRLANQYGFERLDLPIIEYTELYARGVGTASDVFVQKEMYTIEEEDGSSITLRPEFTAGFMRAYLQNGMASWPQPVKLFILGPNFRRERPQAGRYRQHSQFNAEILGETDPAADLEVMMLAMNVYRSLGYQGLTFQLNSTGCPVCRPGYIEKLKAYLAGHGDKLAPVSRSGCGAMRCGCWTARSRGWTRCWRVRPTLPTICVPTVPTILPSCAGCWKR